MDLSTFQLVDAMNDMDMLRNLSSPQEAYCHQEQNQQHQNQHQQQHQPQRQAPSTDDNSAYKQFQGDINLLFHQNQNSNHHINNFIPFKSNTTNNTPSQIMASPHYSRPSSATIRSECFDQQEDIFTPLISPAMTPSFNYQMSQSNKQLTFTSNNDMSFSPLSSPAILPQVDGHQKQTNFLKSNPPNNNSNVLNEDIDQYENMSVNEIYEQYEKLEQEKLLITQKLSQIQKPAYDSNQYQQSLLSSSTARASMKNAFMEHQQSHLNNMSANGHHNMSEPNSPLQSPHMEPATPASLMNMKVNSSTPSKLQFSSSNRTQSYYSNKNASQSQPSSSTSSSMSTPASVSFATTATTAAVATNAFQSPILNTHPVQNSNMIISPMLTPTAIMSNPVGQSVAPPSPLALHPRKPSTRSSLKSEKQTRNKKQRRESTESKPANGIHSSPRALKPLLISPTLNPGPKPLPNAMIGSVSSSSIANSSKNQTVHSVEDAEHILATRSNYQNLMEGKGAALGIAFSTQIKSGLEVRRTAHKAAEQKRRDSLKEWFDRLRHEVEEGYVKRQKTLMSQIIKEQELEKANSSKKNGEANTEEESEDGGSSMKPLSKVLLLQYAYEYIASLKNSLEEKDTIIRKLTADQGESTSHGLKRKQGDTEEESRHSSPSSRSFEEMETIREEDHTIDSE